MKILSLAFMLLGTFIGAGFVSGREIARYFSIFGVYSYWGIFIAIILLASLMLFFFALSHKVKGFGGFINDYFGKLGTVVSWLFSISLIIFSGTMMAGCGEVSTNIHINNSFIIFLTILLCFIVVMKSTRGLSFFNLILLPILMVFLIYVTFQNKIFVSNETFKISFIFDSIFYVFINIVTLGIFIIEIGAGYTKKESFWSVIICVSVILILMLLINNAIQFNNLQLSTMPILTLSKEKGYVINILMSLFVWIGLFSTLASNVYVLKNILPINISSNLKCFIVLILSVFFGFVKFDVFVNYIYLIIGFIGIFLVILLLTKKELMIDKSKINSFKI